jgi:methylmalonyl-CoA/ethylmalonyl-CoA epimerase
MLKKMDHIGVVVKNLESAIKNYTGMFGFKVIETIESPTGEFKNAMLQQGDVRVELFQPLKEGNFYRFLKEKGGGIHHISFSTDNIEKEAKALVAKGKKLQSEKPIELPNARIIFIQQSEAENVLIELVEKK